MTLIRYPREESKEEGKWKVNWLRGNSNTRERRGWYPGGQDNKVLGRELSVIDCVDRLV